MLDLGNIQAAKRRNVHKKARFNSLKRAVFFEILILITGQHPLQIESVQVHHLGPGRDKVFNKLFFGITAGVNLG